MKNLIAALAVVALGGCGLETVGTAATSAALKKQQIEQGKKTLEQAQQQIDRGVELQQQRIESTTDGSADKPDK
jgi:cellobiose-specific phosphotransferase system component IIA